MKVKVLHSSIRKITALIAFIVLIIALSSDRTDAQKIIAEETDTEIVELFEKTGENKVSFDTYLFFIAFSESSIIFHLHEERSLLSSLAIQSQASNKLFLQFNNIKIPHS